MIRRFLRTAGLGLLLVLGTGAARAEEMPEFVFGMLEADDPRYGEWGRHPADTGHLGAYPPRRPYAGAEVAISEAKAFTRAAGQRFVIERRHGKGAAELLAALRDLKAKRGAVVFLVDGPGETVAELARLSRDLGVLLFNVAARDDGLRGKSCQPHLLHTIPSHAMRMDALAQQLIAKRWRKALVLVGPLAEDKKRAASFRRTARRFRIEIVAEKEFLLGADPRSREKNRIPLLTSGEDYDVIFVADADGRFARRLPYAGALPRPVLGDAGLKPLAWHWSYARHGAPQLDSRFERLHKRRMRSPDWAAWMAIKAVVEAVLRTKSTEAQKLLAYLEDPQTRLDGFKGGGYSFRPWSGQLRQRILLAGADWVVAAPPLAGFLHAKNNLDSLGFDEPETTCQR
jgi:ABC transporter substrate binding protein (PQQ-dependent alcohol dehydrogenase system)